MRALKLTTVIAVLVAPLFALGGVRRAAAQSTARDRPVDRIMAIVGTTPILASQVEEQLVLAQSQGA
ncbi:MAG: hypothetical protein DMD34_08165, partial [Gemmatimonadetes bacterium]